MGIHGILENEIAKSGIHITENANSLCLLLY